MLVTLADGQGTSDANWSDWKEGLVWQLYRSARAYFEQGPEYFEKRRVDFEELKKEVHSKLAADYSEEIEAHFQSRVREIVRMPYDPSLATGSTITYSELRPITRDAARELAALVVDGLPTEREL
jgi:UTP:GlnB (protein PII) uridylyltransferase